jgi:predicted nuclease with TOPRIM domain
MKKRLYALFIFNSWSIIWYCSIRFLIFLFKQEVSFFAKINELHQENAELARELRNWENEIVTELKRRQMIECEINRLKIIMQQLHVDNEKFKNQVNEWKFIAEKSQSDTVKHCREIHKILTVLEKIKSKLICTCIKKHHR